MRATNAEATLLAATGRRAIHDAVSWIAEGRRLRLGVPLHELLAALAVLDEEAEQMTGPATALLVRTALASAVDTSRDLLGTDGIRTPSDYRTALLKLCEYTTSKTLRDITWEAVAGAQTADPFVIEALCQVAALSYRDLADHVNARGGSIPSDGIRSWNAAQVQSAFAVIDELVRGLGSARLPGAVVARPVELLMGDSAQPDGWARVSELLEHGVPYEILLTQRAVGGAWLSHRNSTSGLVPPLMATELCGLLDEKSVTYWHGTALGGDVPKKLLGKLVGIEGESGQVGLVTKDINGEPALAVAFAVARDGGTARKSAGKLGDLPRRLKVPAAVVLLGPGWATRGETVDLVSSFEGRLFSERTLRDLGDLAASLCVRER